jgi:hypothetical protein
MSVQITVPCRASFLSNFEESQYNGKKQGYKVQCLVPNDDKAVQKQIVKAIKKAANEKWGDKAPKLIKACMKSAQTFPFWPGENKVNGEGDVYDGYEGTHYLAAVNSKQRPGTFIPAPADYKSATGNRWMQITEESASEHDNAPYSGCHALVTVALWVQDDKNRKAIRCRFLGIAFLKHGDPFGGGDPVLREENAAEAFAGFEPEDDDDGADSFGGKSEALSDDDAYADDVSQQNDGGDDMEGLFD